MYIETSSPRRQGDNAKLQVSVSGSGAAACLEFFYHMYGDTIETLNVYSGNELVFSVSGNQGFYWIPAMKTIYLRNNVSLILFSSKKNQHLIMIFLDFRWLKSSHNICRKSLDIIFLDHRLKMMLL